MFARLRGSRLFNWAGKVWRKVNAHNRRFFCRAAIKEIGFLLKTSRYEFNVRISQVWKLISLIGFFHLKALICTSSVIHSNKMKETIYNVSRTRQSSAKEHWGFSTERQTDHGNRFFLKNLRTAKNVEYSARRKIPTLNWKDASNYIVEKNTSFSSMACHFKIDCLLNSYFSFISMLFSF